jgi:hypothetical protein
MRRRSWVLVLVVVALGTTAATACRRADASTAPAAPAAPAAEPFWCRWIPEKYRPPECRPATASPSRSSPTPSAATPVETRFAGRGPSSVRTDSATDASGNAFTLFYPTNVGESGVDHPILTWGNGTGSSPDDYADTLRHLASWGFVVVASNRSQTGDGTAVLAGARYMVDENDNPASVFHGKLDTAAVGALGHSQGATGAVQATIRSRGLIGSTVAINFVDPFWFWPRSQMPDLSRLRSPVFFASGGSDFFSTGRGQQRYFAQVRGPAAMGALRGGDHNEIERAGNGYLGYVTAWLRYTLKADRVAGEAFVGGSPELADNPDWQGQAVEMGSAP